MREGEDSSKQQQPPGDSTQSSRTHVEGFAPELLPIAPFRSDSILVVPLGPRFFLDLNETVTGAEIASWMAVTATRSCRALSFAPFKPTEEEAAG